MMKYIKYTVLLIIMTTIGLETTYAMNINIYQEKLMDSGMLIAVNNRSNISCNELFDSETKQLLNDILMYPKIIVPLLVIGLGTVDLAKAVFASKEDEMRKAQSTFIKRLIIGLAFYFVPVIVNILMWLANVVWNGSFTTCGL